MSKSSSYSIEAVQRAYRGVGARLGPPIPDLALPDEPLSRVGHDELLAALMPLVDALYRSGVPIQDIQPLFKNAGLTLSEASPFGDVGGAAVEYGYYRWVASREADAAKTEGRRMRVPEDLSKNLMASFIFGEYAHTKGVSIDESSGYEDYVGLSLAAKKDRALKKRLEQLDFDAAGIVDILKGTLGTPFDDEDALEVAAQLLDVFKKATATAIRLKDGSVNFRFPPVVAIGNPRWWSNPR